MTFNLHTLQLFYKHHVTMMDKIEYEAYEVYEAVDKYLVAVTLAYSYVE
jgi:hypothetical protein